MKNNNSNNGLSEAMEEFILDRQIHFLKRDSGNFEVLKPTEANLSVKKNKVERLRIDSISSSNLLKKSTSEPNLANHFNLKHLKRNSN
jgi:hypothetical protein